MRWSALLVPAALLALTGCADGGGGALPLPGWTFEGPDGSRAPVVLPAHLDAHLPQETSRYVLRTQAAVPAELRDRPLTLVIPRLAAHVALRVDGAPAESLDAPDPPGYRTKGPHAWRVPATATHDGALDLELAVEHTWTQSAWVDTVPRLSPDLDGGRVFVAQRAFNELTAAAALCVALLAGYLYLVVFLADRRRRDYGWFALTGLAGMGYPLFQTGLLEPYAGRFDPLLAGLGVTSAVIAEMHFAAARFHLPRPSRAWDAAFFVSAFATTVSVGYFNARIGGMAAAIILVPALIAEARLFLVLLLRKPRPPDLLLILGGWPFMLLAAAPDLLAWVGAGELLGGWRPACLGILLIGLLQTGAMSRAHTKSLRVADDLNAELRRQIAARSRELADALARLGQAAGDGDRPLAAGEVIEGRYEVIRPLGAGGGGAVYLVERRSDRALLAMKVVHGGDDAHRLARLAREAELAAEVKHPNVVEIVDVDVAASGFLYIVMEYLPGATLREHKEKYGRPDWALPVLAQIADGLAAIHARGIVHRDLKPGNLLVLSRAGRAPAVKIADFGIARGERPEHRTERLGAPARPADGTLREEAPLTETGAIMGTPFYMAPELVDGARDASAAVDVFAFGVIAYQLLTGRAPFRESPAFALAEGVILAPPPTVASVRPGVPSEVGALVDRCLAFEPADRPTAPDAHAVLARHAAPVIDDSGGAEGAEAAPATPRAGPQS
jgi:serine/threonine-protein kinase